MADPLNAERLAALSDASFAPPCAAADDASAARSSRRRADGAVPRLRRRVDPEQHRAEALIALRHAGEQAVARHELRHFGRRAADMHWLQARAKKAVKAERKKAEEGGA